MVRVSCVIPAYNEATTVADVVRAAHTCAVVDEVIVVSDGSTDATPLRATEAGADLVLLQRNRGKGAAVLAGTRAARGEVIVLLDADLCRLTPDHVEQLVRPVLAGDAQMAVAVFADDYWHEVLSPLSGQRAVRRALLLADPELERAGFGFEMALDRLAKTRGASICQVDWTGVSHRRKHRKYGMVRGLSLQLRASSDLVRQQTRAVHARHPRGPAVLRRRPRMEALLLALVVLLVITQPLFFAHPSQAAALHLPTLQPPGPGDRLLVVVAHPDDEVIGAGGLIAAARSAGIPVSVLFVTNGDSNRVAAALVGRRLPPRAGAFIREGRLRQQEAVTASQRLGVDPRALSFLGFPDRQVQAVMRSPIQPVVSKFTGMKTADYPGVVDRGAPYTRSALVDLTRSIIAQVQPTVIITHSPLDRHSDHAAVFDLVNLVRGETPVYTFVVHAPGFPRPLRSSPADPLLPPPGVALPQPWTWMRYELSADAERAKRAAIGAHRSQMATPYLRLLLVSFVRTNELFAVQTDVMASRAR